MKIKFLLGSILLLFVTMSVSSQDLMVTSSGEVIKAYNIEIAGNAIFYRLSTNESDAIQRIAKSELLMIKREDGTVTSFAEQTTSTPEVQSPVVAESPKVQTQQKPTVDPVQNKKIISSINREIKFSGEVESSDENLRYFLQYYADEESVFEDSNLKVELRTRDIKDPLFAFWVTNKSDEVIRIDLSNSYYVIGTNSTVMREKGGTTVVSKSGTKGASVNLGGVARAVGIGGAIGGLANAVNVGGSSTNTVSKYIEDESYVVILPPNASSFLTGWEMIEPLDDSSYANGFSAKKARQGGVAAKAAAGGVNSLGSADWSGTISQMGDEKKFGKDDANNLKIGSHITYYKGNDLQTPQSIRSTLYLAKAMGINDSTKDLSPGWSDGLFYVKKPVYPPHTDKFNQIVLSYSYGLTFDSFEVGSYSTKVKYFENVSTFSASYYRIRARYKHKYDKKALLYGGGLRFGVSNSIYTLLADEQSYGGYLSTRRTVREYDYIDTKVNSLSVVGVIGGKMGCFSILVRPHISYDVVNSDYNRDNYDSDNYDEDWFEEPSCDNCIGGGLEICCQATIKRITIGVSPIDFHAGAILNTSFFSNIAIGFQF